MSTQKEENDRAITEYSHALRFNPQDADMYYNRAIADFSQVIRLDANNALVYNNRGVAYFSKGNKRRARADFKRASKITPNFTAIQANFTGTRKRGLWERQLRN